MNEQKPYCEAKDDIDKLANDALNVVNKIEKRDLPKELELGLERIEKDLNEIIMDNHHPRPNRPTPPPPPPSGP